MSARVKRLAAALLAALAAITITLVVAVDDSDHDGRPDRTTVTITLGGPGKEHVTLPPAAQATAQGQAAKAAAGDDEVHVDLRTEPSAATAPSTLEHNALLKPGGQVTIPKTVPLAAAHVNGCRTLLVRNYSSRNGAPVLLGVTHYTVSTDNGWAGVLGNVRWFDQAASQASSNEIIDRKQGACALVVAESQSAWTQAGFNRWSVSVEVTARGNEGALVVGKGRDRLVALYRGWHRRWKLPYRHGKVSGCKVVRSGFVTHQDLGACGGGHVDVSPYSIDEYIAQAKRLDERAAAKRKPSAKVRRWCHLAHTRRDGHAHERRKLARRDGFRCVKGEAVR